MLRILPSRPSSVLPCSSRHAYSAQVFPLYAISKFKMMTKSCFYEAKENVTSAFKQYTNQRNASNLLQPHFGSPQWKELESGIAPLVPRGFDPACWGLIQLPPSPWGGHLSDISDNSTRVDFSCGGGGLKSEWWWVDWVRFIGATKSAQSAAVDVDAGAPL